MILLKILCGGGVGDGGSLSIKSLKKIKIELWALVF